MCDDAGERPAQGMKTVPVAEAVGTVLAHDITEIRPGEFKGPAFRKGHIVREEDVCHLQRLGKENLYVLNIAEDEVHEDDAATALAETLMGEGVAAKGRPREGKIDIIAERDGLLRIDRDALLKLNMLGEVMCATLHDNTVVKEGSVVAGTRAIPLLVKRRTLAEAVGIASSVSNAGGVISVNKMRRPRAGVVITGNEVYYGRVKDAFAPVIRKKIEAACGEIVGLYYAPDDVSHIEARLRELMDAGADLIITTGGMSVDPDDVTRFAVRNAGATELIYGSAALPGAMFLVAYLTTNTQKGDETDIPVLGIPACGMYASTTVFDLVLPRILAGQKIGRRELAELGHGGLCMKCETCMYPVCPFGKS